MTLPGGTFTYAVGALLTYAIFTLTYRLAFHPLSKYPGPLLSRLTNGYSGYHAIRRRLHLATYADHLKYGPVIRQGPNRLVFNTITALQDIYLHPNVIKAQTYKHSQFSRQTNIFGTVEKEKHRQKRKMYGQVLADRSLRAFEPTMIQEIDVFLKFISSAGNSPVDMSPQCERLTADIAGQLAFGQSLNTLTQETNRLLPRAMMSVNMIISMCMAWPAIGYVRGFLRLLNMKKGREFLRVVQGLVKRRMAIPANARHDLYSIVTASAEAGEEGIRNTELWGEAVFFMPAGGTTTSTALSSIFFYLSRYPAIYAKLATEIRSTFKSGNDLKTGSLLSSCRYLRAVIDESLRIAPPLTTTLWRELEESSPTPLVVDGHVIPRGVMVGINPFSLMHKEEYFPDPFKFQPERWLAPEDEAQETPAEKEARETMRKAFAPFALGDTRCLGKSMAYHETSLIIAKTLWYFDFEKAPGETGKLGEGEPGRLDGRHRVDEYQLYDTLTADHEGPNLVFKARKFDVENF
ncbi:Cytochrome P450 monooxygenase atnE [Paramyrothecium foliicola]|nr:Cytochrome P450 monooxygenase atnE [Paramyrothecium foliicola]